MLSTPTKLTINRVLSRAGLGPDEVKAIGAEVRQLAEYDLLGLQLEAFMPHTGNEIWTPQNLATGQSRLCDIPLIVLGKPLTLRYRFSEWQDRVNLSYQIGHTIENEDSDGQLEEDFYSHFGGHKHIRETSQGVYDVFREWAKELFQWASSPTALCRLCKSPVRKQCCNLC